MEPLVKKLIGFALLIVFLGLVSGFVYNFISKRYTALESTAFASPIPTPTPTPAPTLPTSFPSDFPVYSPATLEDAAVTESETGQGISAVWQTSDKLDDVSQFFMTELKKAGYKVVTNADNPESEDEGAQILTFGNSKTEGFIGLAQDGGSVVISVTLSFENPPSQ